MASLVERQKRHKLRTQHNVAGAKQTRHQNTTTGDSPEGTGTPKRTEYLTEPLQKDPSDPEGASRRLGEHVSRVDDIPVKH